MALIKASQDLFTGSGLDPAWTQFLGGSATMTFAGAGASVILPATTSSSTDGDLSRATGDLTSNFIILNVTSVPGASATHTDAILRLRLDGSNCLQVFYEAGTLFFSKIVAGSQTNIASVAYNAITHAWWGIFEQSGITSWVTSNDGITFTVQASQSNPIAVTSLIPLVGAICFGIDTAPSPFTFRYYNFPKSNNINLHMRVGNGMSRSEVAN